MKGWKTILTFTYPTEAHLAKAKLESEAIEVMILDELSVQVNHFQSNAIGGVKLLVREVDFEKAYQILIESGYLKEPEQRENKFLKRVDKFTSGWPVIGETLLEIRLIALIMIMLIIIAIPIIWLSIPSTSEKLTKNRWCVDKIYYKGQELTPQSLGFKIVSDYENCTETMNFQKDGSVTFPGLNTFEYEHCWELEKKQLIITDCTVTVKFAVDDKLGPIQIVNDNKEKSIFPGVYELVIKNNQISLYSDSVEIFGSVYKYNFRF